MFRFFLAILLFTATVTGPPAQAQVNWDIPIVETPEGGGGSDIPGTDAYCDTCCNQGLISPDCQRNCGCNGGLPCASYSSMRAAQTRWPVIAGVVGSVRTTREQLAKTPRGKTLLAAWETHADRVDVILKKNPGLAKRVGQSLAQFWPHDMWTNTGDKAHKVTAEAMKELRDLLAELARADQSMGGSAVGDTIRKDVLPHLGKDLVDQPYHKAFACFIGSESCS